MGLLEFKMNKFSQGGEDGIIERIFSLVGISTKTFCEFGAWDGIYLSNTRKLVMEGWSGLYIEANSSRFEGLKKNCATYPGVKCINRFIYNSSDLESALAENGFQSPVDLLSIDIDGLDYFILAELKTQPRLICIEANWGHPPESTAIVPPEVAVNGIGEPLLAFSRAAKALGYRLIAYNHNAFFLREDIAHPFLPELDPATAYIESMGSLTMKDRRLMYITNKGWVYPYYKFENNYLTADRLGLGHFDIIFANTQAFYLQTRRLLRRFATRLGLKK